MSDKVLEMADQIVGLQDQIEELLLEIAAKNRTIMIMHSMTVIRDELDAVSNTAFRSGAVVGCLITVAGFLFAGVFL